MSNEYIEVLRDSFKHRPELLRAYLDGCWDDLGGYNQVIKDAWVNNAAKIMLYPPVTKHLISCDPARYGDDETVIYCLENTTIKEQEIYGKKGLMHTANVLHVLSRKYDNALIARKLLTMMWGMWKRSCQFDQDEVEPVQQSVCVSL